MIDEVEWRSMVIEVNDYLKADPTLNEGLKQIIQLNLKIGDNNPDERVAAKGALKALLKGRDGTPFKRGQKSSVPATVRVSIDKAISIIEIESLNYYNSHPIMSKVLRKHIKSGGGDYANGEEYAHIVGKRMRNALAKRYKDGDWDGEYDSLLTTTE
jgi:hypothetical protein